MDAALKRRWYQFPLWMWFFVVLYVAMAAKVVGVIVEVANDSSPPGGVDNFLSERAHPVQKLPQPDLPAAPPDFAEFPDDVKKLRHQNYLAALQSAERLTRSFRNTRDDELMDVPAHLTEAEIESLADEVKPGMSVEELSVHFGFQSDTIGSRDIEDEQQWTFHATDRGGIHGNLVGYVGKFKSGRFIEGSLWFPL